MYVKSNGLQYTINDGNTSGSVVQRGPRRGEASMSLSGLHTAYFNVLEAYHIFKYEADYFNLV
jgi:hypothetical protein